MSSAKIRVGDNVESLTTSPRFDSYTAVELRESTNSDPITVGDTSLGRTLSVTCTYATEAMANNILSKVSGYSYQPYTASNAYLEPAAEIGDGVTTNGIYSGIFSQDISFGKYMSSDIKAPTDESFSHEFGYVDENGKFATYTALANGTAKINGSGVIDNTLNGSKVVDTSLSEGKTAFQSTLNQVGTNASNISVNAQGIAGLQSEFSVIKNGNFGQISTSRIVLGNYRLYVSSDGDCRGEYIG